MVHDKRIDDVKCVIFDLDDTLWNGILLEDPMSPIPLHNRNALFTLVNRGIAVSIASKNEHEAVKKRLEAEGLWHLFVFPMINYHPKSENIKLIIEQMQLRSNNIAFIDDNKFNLEEVKSVIPDIQVYTEEKWHDLLDAPQFNPKKVSSEAADRVLRYKVEEKRKKVKTNFSSYDGFLKSCGIHCNIYSLHQDYIPRILELINRTNQLNFTKTSEGRSEEYLLNAIRKGSGYVLNVRDKFGDHGIVGFMVLKDGVIEDLVFSCRILSMFIENEMLQWLFSKAKSKGCQSLTILSDNPKLASTALIDEGFEEKAIGTWERSLERWIPQNRSFIKVLEKRKGVYHKTAVYVPDGRPTIFLKGGCDIRVICSVINGVASPSLLNRIKRSILFRMPFLSKTGFRFTKLRADYDCIDDLNHNGHNEHSAKLVASLDMNNEDRELVKKMLGTIRLSVLDERDFSRYWIESEYDIFVWSPVIDATQQMFRIKGTKIILTLGAYNIADFPIPSGRDENWLKMNVEPLGLIQEEEFICNMNRTFSAVVDRSPSRQIVVFLANEHDPIQDEYTDLRIHRHKQVNEWLRSLKSQWQQLHLIDTNTITQNRCSELHDIRHYDRETYMLMGQKLLDKLDVLTK